MIPQQTTAYIPTWATQGTPAPQQMLGMGTTAMPIGGAQGSQQPLGGNSATNPIGQQLKNNIAQGALQGALKGGGVSGAASGATEAASADLAPLAAMCCWIMVYGNGGYMPWFIKPLRNIVYEKEPEVQRGYEWMANWLVPLMMLSSIIDGLIRALIVEPLTEHCAYINSIKGARARTNYQRFWFSVWRLIGKYIVKEDK